MSISIEEKDKILKLKNILEFINKAELITRKDGNDVSNTSIVLRPDDRTNVVLKKYLIYIQKRQDTYNVYLTPPANNTGIVYDYKQQSSTSNVFKIGIDEDMAEVFVDGEWVQNVENFYHKLQKIYDKYMEREGKVSDPIREKVEQLQKIYEYNKDLDTQLEIEKLIERLKKAQNRHIEDYTISYRSLKKRF